MQLTGNQLIAGQSSAQSSETFHATNPATGQRMAPDFHEATSAEIDSACTAAADAFPAIRAKPAGEKSQLLRAVAEQIMALGDGLVVRATEETGLPRARIEMERGRTCNQLRLFADVVEAGSWVDARIDRAQLDRQPLPKPDIRRMLVPIGPVVVFGASNFPLAFSVGGGDSASALAAGCPVVCKGHPAHPGTSELVARAAAAAVQQCGFPPATFSLIQGAKIDAAIALVTHPAIQAVGFTGSLQAGRALFDHAARRPQPIPVYAEMGSTNPVFILPGALAQRGDEIAKGLVASVTLGVGQFCTKPGLVFLPGLAASAASGSGMIQTFLDQTTTALQAVAPGIMLHAGIRAHFQSNAKRLGETPGVTTKLAAAPSTTPGCAQSAMFFQTTAENFLARPEIGIEVFGPSTVAITASSREQILMAARGLQGHLTATIHGTPGDLREWKELIDILQTKVGRIIFNGWPTGVEVTHAMVHGGPYPATTDPRATSVGTAAIHRWARPVCFQGFPSDALPEELRDGNPRGIWRLVEGKLSRD